MSQNPNRPETTATGIAGAMDYRPSGQAVRACWVCGGDMDAPRTRPVARALPGVGVVQACSPTCAAASGFAGRMVLQPSG